MRRLKRFAEISWTERWLLLRALFIIVVARASLWLLPVAAARRLVTAATAVRGHEGCTAQCVWAVKIASRYVPRATCLIQALAVQSLLAQAGRDAHIELGVAKDAGKFEAHAWVVCGDRIVIGGPDVSRYSRLTTWVR